VSAGKLGLRRSLSQRGLFALGRYLTVPGLPRFSLRARLCLFVGIVLIPALILTGILASRSISAERIRIDEGLESRLNQLSVEIEREIQSTTALLVVLAESHLLQTDDLEGFHRSAEEVSRQLGIQIVVHRPQLDKRVISTGVPWEQSPELTLPEVYLEAEREAIRSGKTVISDVFFAPISQRYMVSVVTAVMRNGSAEYVLAIGIPIQKIAEILENASPGPNRTAVVMDRSSTVIARSERNPLWAGTKALTEFSSQLSGNEGVFNAVNRIGEAFHGRYRRSETTGWYVTVGVRAAALNASARDTIVYTAAAGTTLFAFAIGLTFLLGGRLEQKVGTLGIDRRPTREEFALFFDSAPNGVVLVDNNGTVLLANARIEQMFGYTKKELVGQPVETLIPSDRRAVHVRHRQDFAYNPAPRSMGAERNLLGWRKGGSEFPIEVGLYPITIQTVQYTMATVIDITERSVAAKALSDALIERDRLRRHLMRSAEDERLRLSHELHDQTGQTLTAATLAAKSIEKFLDTDGRQQLTKLNALLDQMGRTLHQVAWELRPASIDELGLTATLENYVSDWSDQTGIAAEFYCKSGYVDSLPDDVRTTIYRVIQEALTNIAKHAHEASRVSVVISRTGALLQLTIDDNGDGFDLAETLGKPSKYGSLGIPSMRERLSLIGGTLEIESSEGIGTTVFARIPIERGEAPR
jgi:two-component system, NarL family, sensor histidine kinase UhpB